MQAIRQFRFIAVALVAACMPLHAQTARDSSHATGQKIAADSIATNVLVPLTQYCGTKNAVGYLKTACGILARQLIRLSAGELALVTPPLLPPVPVPVDTAPTPTPTPIPAPTPQPIDSSSAVELPRVFLNTAVSNTPSTGRTITTTNLQAALDTALDGDRIVLPCVAAPTGNFILRPRRAGGKSGEWVTVTTGCALPTEGTRTTPAQLFAKITSPNVLPALSTIGAASKWRFVGVEITHADSVPTNQGLVALGCANQCETDTVSQPRDIIFDRSYIHGTATGDVRRCLGFNGQRLAVIDSYVSACHSGFDAQAVAGWNGPGPFKIVNNYLEGAAENIAFGGGDPVSGVGIVPSDIEIRHNHLAKQMSWKGGRWLIKNLIELKIGRRVLIEGNVMENAWPAGQNGFGFVLWSVNQQGTCPWCVTEQVTIQNNIIRNVSGGWSMDAVGSNGNAALVAVPMNHVLIRNNLVVGLDNPAVSGYGRLFEISATTPGVAISNLTIEHNTGFSPSNSSFIWAGAGLPMPYQIIKNNLVGGGQYQLFSPWGQGQIAWDHAGVVGSIFDHNAVAEFSGGNMIANNWGDSFAAFGIVNPYSVTNAPTDFVLPASSILKGKATDGTDVGADIGRIITATQGVVQTTSTQRIRVSKP